MSKPNMKPAGNVESPPRPAPPMRSVCIRCERRRAMRLSLWCAECETAVNGTDSLPLFAEGGA